MAEPDKSAFLCEIQFPPDGSWPLGSCLFAYNPLMEFTKERLRSWWRESLGAVQKKWWLFLFPLIAWILRGVLEDRFFGSINRYLDSHAPNFLHGCSRF
jgi:hypothetical protein